MINITKIQNSLVGLVGFKQPYNPDYAILDAGNQLSSSGYFVTDNPYAKIEYIKDNQDYLSISDLDFNLAITDLKKSAISNVCNQVFNEYDFLDRSLLFKYASNKQDVESLPVGFVGYRVKVDSKKNIAFKINRVLLDFYGTGNIKLLLWNTAQKAVIESKEISITSDHQEEVLEWVIDNSGTTYKGEYYIGYISDGLTVTPYKREYEAANLLTNPTYLYFEKVTVIGHITEVLFDLNDVDGMSEECGLNFDITVYDDFTDFAINNKMLFARAIQLQAIISCAQMYMASLRSNSNQINSEQLYQKIMVEIEGTSGDSVVRVHGLKNQLLGEITSIRSEIAKLKKGFFKSGQILRSTLR